MSLLKTLLDRNIPVKEMCKLITAKKILTEEQNHVFGIVHMNECNFALMLIEAETTPQRAQKKLYQQLDESLQHTTHMDPEVQSQHQPQTASPSLSDPASECKVVSSFPSVCKSKKKDYFEYKNRMIIIDNEIHDHSELAQEQITRWFESKYRRVIRTYEDDD